MTCLPRSLRKSRSEDTPTDADTHPVFDCPEKSGERTARFTSCLSRLEHPLSSSLGVALPVLWFAADAESPSFTAGHQVVSDSLHQDRQSTASPKGLPDIHILHH